jgi:PAS domain S-box-containing protein
MEASMARRDAHLGGDRDPGGDLLGGPLQEGAEGGLADRDDLYRALIETTGAGYVVLDREGRVLDANQEYVRLAGFRALRELRGRSVVEWTAEHDKRRTAEAIERCLRLGRVRNLEIDYVGAGGAPSPIEVNATLVGQGDGVRILSLCRGIAERQRAAQTRQSSEETFKRLIEGAPDAVYVQTRGAFAYVNGACCRLLGADSPAALLGQPIFDRIHPEFHAMVRERVRHINEDHGRNPPLEETYLRLDGSPVAVEVTAVPIVFGGESGALVFLRDITDKRRVDEALRNAQKLEAIGVLAGGIAHDFNNLLGGAFGYVEVARAFLARGDTGRASASLESATEVFGRARALTRELLTFAKGGTPVRSTIAVTPLLTAAVRFALSGSPIECRFEIPDDLWPCCVDEHQIGQVIDNIVINAVQAMPSGGVVSLGARNLSIEHDQHPALSKGDYVRLELADTGVGIPKPVLPRIFEPFFTTKETGSGLGLAISYSIVKRHGGTIDVESEPGVGTRLVLYLPAQPGALAARSEPASLAFSGRGRVLIMDDVESIRNAVAQMAEILGFEAATAADGEEALRVAAGAVQASRPFSAAILDLTIPGGRGGREVAGDLLALDPGLKLIASTGYSEDPAAGPGDHGFAARLTKPYRMQELAEVLRAVLDA